MTKKIYHLGTCNTCKRIINELELGSDFERQDVKKQPLTEAQLADLYRRTDSYEELFNRRSQEYRKRNLAERDLTENDYRELLLDHYSFLKRPVILIGERTYVGNAKRTVAAAAKAVA